MRKVAIEIASSLLPLMGFYFQNRKYPLRTYALEMALGVVFFGAWFYQNIKSGALLAE